MKALLLLFGLCIVLVWAARRHAPTRHKIRSIWHGHVTWESNTSMLRATASFPTTSAPVENVKVLPPPWLRVPLEAPAGEKDMTYWTRGVFTPEQQARLATNENGVDVTTAVPVVVTNVALPPVYFILLRHVTERVQHVQSMLQQHPALNAKIWPAVTTDDLNDPIYSHAMNRQTFKKVRQGAIGCALSHITLLEHMISENIPEMIVFEDDAQLSLTFEKDFVDFRTHLPNDFDFGQFLHHKSMKKLRHQAKFVLNDVVMKSYSPYGTVGYYVTLAGAKKMLPTLKPIWYPIDEMFRNCISKKVVNSYMPVNDLVTMPYKYSSNIWKTVKKAPIQTLSKSSETEVPAICKNFPFIWKDDRKTEMLKLLQVAHDMFEQLGIDYVIHSGTALGYARHNQHQIPWDDDIDLYIKARDVVVVKAYIETSTVYCHGSLWLGFKFFKCDSPKAGRYAWSYPMLDIFTITKANNGRRVFKALADDIAWPSVLSEFEGQPVRIPADITRHLNIKYGSGWSTTCAARTWDHENERGTGFKSKLECTELTKQCGSQWPKDMWPSAIMHGCLRGISMNPFDLIRNHWDIIVKAVYASAYLNKNPVPEKIADTYTKLNLAWGGGREKCDKNHNPTQQTHQNCVPKKSIDDFVTAFRATIDSMNINGFDSNKGLVPVIPTNGVFFAINGAHRIGAAIATKKQVCVEKVKLREHNWDEKYFKQKGVPNSDTIMRHWALLDKKMIVIMINPPAVVLESKMRQARKIIESCSDTKSIIFEKDLQMNSDRMETVLSFAYGAEEWFQDMDLVNYARGFLTKQSPISRFFVIHGTQKNMKECKLRLRRLFDFKPRAFFKKSCHIGDNYAQHLKMANYIFAVKKGKRHENKRIRPILDTITSDTTVESKIDWSGQPSQANASYSKTIFLNNRGVKSLAEHLYNKDDIPHIDIHADGQAKRPVVVSFYDNKKCEHNCLTRVQTTVLAQMTLNDNSIMFLNRHHGKNCKDVAYELASRFGLNPAIGTFFKFTTDIMIDSGAVMSFFGLRKRTDIDILFKSQINQSVLGWKHKNLIEAHAFDSNNLRNGRAWGQDHITPTRSVDDLFTDPQNYGYCHGVKFVSLQQLVRYKTRRGEPNKDEKDVAQINNFLKDEESNEHGFQVWVCGSNWNYPVLAKSLFGKSAKLFQDNKGAFKNDILVYGVGSKCHNLKDFPGYVLTMNGESRRSHRNKREKHFFIGPWVEKYNTLMVYNVARRYLSLKNLRPDWFSSKGLPYRLQNDGEYFAIYAAGNCKTYRDNAFKRLNSIETAHVSGRCPVNVATTKSPYATARSLNELNPILYSHYRFVLCMENRKEAGYITEKILYAFISGAIPIYYGTEEVFDIFNKNAFVYYDINNPQNALDTITKLNEDEEAYLTMTSQPIFTEGIKTVEKYFSLDDDLGSGKLKNRILDMMGIVPKQKAPTL